MSASPLDPSREEVVQWGEEAVAWMADYLKELRDHPVYPNTSSAEIRARLDAKLPEEGVPFSELLTTFRDDIVALTRQSAHPRMFGYVQAPGVPIAAFADLLASTLNSNLTAWRSAPSAVEVERLTINWIKQIVGYPDYAEGLFTSGGSMANFCGLAAARHSKVPNESKPLCLYASCETHHSVAKAAHLLGLARDNVRLIDVDADFRIRLDQLVARIEQDLVAGYRPFFLVGNAGTVATGAIDPLSELAEIAKRYQLWFHVDACYGGFAALAPAVRPKFDALGEADSVALDPHKWLYLPADCGCILYRDPSTARQTFAHDAEYTRIFQQTSDQAFAFWDYGPDLSRRFRALKVWMLLKGVGLKGLRASVEKDLACARHLEALVKHRSDFEMLAPVELSIFCFRYLPPRCSEDELDTFNERLLVALQQDGSSYLSNASLNGKFALRGCVINFRTSPRDMEILLDDLRRVAGQLPH